MTCRTCERYDFMGFGQACPCTHINGVCMQPPTKTQAKLGIDNPTLDASQGDTARQEFKDEADINYMLSRFGITPTRGAPIYGEWDDTINLQSALQAVSDARAAYNELPENLRAKFSRMEDLLAALENGSLIIKNEEPPEPPKPPEVKAV